MGSFENNKKENGHQNEKHRNNSSSIKINRNNAKESSITITTLSGHTFAITSLVFVILVAFVSLQIYLPRASSTCTCPSTNGQLSITRPFNFSGIGKPTILSDGRIRYQIAVISDLDHDSKFEAKKDTWRSFMRKGHLFYHPELQTVQVEWDEKEAASLYSQLSSGGRAMELSDLAVFDGKLLTVDDRTGVIYKIENFNTMLPWVILNDGPGNTTKGFKAEWMTVKDQHLYVGGLGKEWTTTDGKFVNYHPMWIKIINPYGEVIHVDWTENYKKLRQTVGIEFPGYMIHESGQWSDIHRKWFFLPRRASKDIYSEDEDEHKGTNMLLIANEDFGKIEKINIGTIGDGSRGFSAFQFLPGTEDQIMVALKSEERNGKAVASYLCIFRLSDGQIILPEQKFDGPYKFEGLILY